MNNQVNETNVSEQYNITGHLLLENNNININGNEYTSNISLITLKSIISSIKEEIQQGNIVKKKSYEIEDIVHLINRSRDESEEYQHICLDFINFLEIYNAQYKDKYDDLINHILENLTNDDKQACCRDHNGKIVLLSKPRLERSYNVNHNIKNNKMYKLILSITNHIKNIVQYESDYNINNPSVLDTT